LMTRSPHSMLVFILPPPRRPLGLFTQSVRKSESWGGDANLLEDYERTTTRDPTPVISLEPATVANSLCRGQE
jgi:hypothetical protein